MHKLISQPTLVFVQAIKNGLNHWASKTIDLDADSIKALDPDKENIFRIVDHGLQLPELWQPTAELMIQVFPLPDRNGYWNLWLEKLAVVIHNGPKPATPTLVRLQINYGKLLRSLWQLEEAKKVHQIAMQDAQNIKDDVLLAHVLMEMGWDYLWENDLGKAQLVGENALQIFETVENAPIVQLIDTLRILGDIATTRGENSQAINLLKRALVYARKIRKPLVLARTYVSLGMAFRRMKDMPEALDCFDNANEALAGTTYESDKINVFLNIGSIYFDQEMWDEAEETFNKANNLYLRESGNLQSQALLWNNLGNVYWKQGRLEEAENFLRDALKIWVVIGDEVGWANTLAVMAEVLFLEDRVGEAKQVLNEALKKVEKYSEHTGAKRIRGELEDLKKRIEGGE